MLLESSSEVSLGISDVDLSTLACIVSRIVSCFSMGRGSLTLVSMDRKVGPDLNNHSDVVVPARLSDPLTNTCYVR